MNYGYIKQRPVAGNLILSHGINEVNILQRQFRGTIFQLRFPCAVAKKYKCKRIIALILRHLRGIKQGFKRVRKSMGSDISANKFAL